MPKKHFEVMLIIANFANKSDAIGIQSTYT